MQFQPTFAMSGNQITEFIVILMGLGRKWLRGIRGIFKWYRIINFSFGNVWVLDFF